MNLLVDIGNARIKWAGVDGAALSRHGAAFYTAKTLPQVLAENWRQLPRPRKAAVAGVADAAAIEAIRGFTSKTWSLEPWLARPERECAGVTCAYHDPTALGVDRWLAMLAAWRRFERPLCLIDCGTAVTFDVILERGRHQGGFILPGLGLSAAALGRGTRRVQVRDAPPPVLEWGRSTAACISNGFGAALAGLLEYSARQVERQEGVRLLPVLTGGEAPLLAPLLPEHCRHEPHLVLEGLNLVA